MSPKPLNSLLIKPTSADCNLRCAYCFYLEKCNLYPETARHRMTDETLSVLIEQMMALGGSHPSFGWQGGEPTLMGLDFFRRVIAYQREFGSQGQMVGNGLQTNGYLLTPEWGAFLAANQFLVGLSLDGPQHIHDHYRRNAGGAETWERVIRNSRMLQRMNVAVNSLVTVSDYSAQFPEEIYDFLREEGYDFLQFIPIVETHAEGGQAAPFSLSSEAFGEFFCRILDRWVQDFRDGMPTVSVRWFDSLLHTYVGLKAPECPMDETCGVYLAVEHNGDVYPCDFFVEPAWLLGNIHRDRLDHLLNSEKMTRFGDWKKRDLPEKCQACRWYPRCFGGCTKDRVKDPRDQGLSHFCDGMIRFFEHADPIFRRLAERWKKRQQAMADAERVRSQSGAPTRQAAANAESGQPHSQTTGTKRKRSRRKKK